VKFSNQLLPESLRAIEVAWPLLIVANEGVQSNRKIKSSDAQKENATMVWTILVVLFVLWLIGLIAHIGGGLIHLLLVVALIVFLINLLTGRRTV
jgi:hypothetical protein